MATYRELWNDLVAVIPRLPPPHAQTLINRAWADIRDLRLWSWLVGTGYIVTPVVITSGSITVTQGSASVTPDATAAAALNAVVSANPPLAHAQIGIGRQIRIASQTSGTPGPLYSIVAYNNATPVLTLDRPYLESSASSVPYTCYKALYQAPPADGTSTPDFLRFLSLTNPASGYTIRGRRLYYSQAQLNALDPQRGAQGEIYMLAQYPNDPSTGRTVFEGYPHPQVQRVYAAIYQKRGLDLSDANAPPPSLPYDVIMERAYQLGCQWALSQVSVFPELQQTNWVQALMAHQQIFKERLIQAIKADDELMPEMPIFQGRTIFDYPIGGSWAQSHALPPWFGANG